MSIFMAVDDAMWWQKMKAPVRMSTFLVSTKWASLGFLVLMKELCPKTEAKGAGVNWNI